MPPDLEAALAASPAARARFDALNKTNRYAVIWRLMTAKTERTRASRLAKQIAMLEAGETFR